MRAALVRTNQETECQCQTTQKTNGGSVMLESLKRVRVIQSVKIRLSYLLESEQGYNNNNLQHEMRSPVRH